MKKILYLATIGMFLYSCNLNSSSSINKNLSNGLLTKGKNLSCSDVKIFIDGKESNSNDVIYGQKVEFKFINIDGFKSVNGNVFPGLKMNILNSKGDTVLAYDDMYTEYDKSGLNISPLTLYSTLTLADPIHSNEKYSLIVSIWDKKSNGTFEASYSINLIPNSKIKTKSNGIEASEIYLFSKLKGDIVTNNEISERESINFFIENIEGFYEEDGLVFPGISMKINDANNNILLDNIDMFSEYTEGIEMDEFKKQIFVNFNVYGKDLKSPITIKCNLWDKKSDNYLELETKCTVNK